MACSRLFSGDLPEISICIIQNLRNNIKTLYSLVLVNRFWCRLAIPLLWEDPFSIKYLEHSSHFLNTYLLFLNENDKNEVKKILKSYKFNTKSKPLFNYPSLIKNIDLIRIQLHVVEWFDSNNTPSTSSEWSFTKVARTIFSVLTSKPTSNRKPHIPLTVLNHSEIDIEEHSTYVRNQRVKVIFTILFKLFIENNVSLDNLSIILNGNSPNQLFYCICDMILNNPKFISKIKTFSFQHRYFQQLQQNLSTQNFLSSLPLPTSIKHFDIFYDPNIAEFKEIFANIIQSQSQLSSIRFGFRLMHFEVHLFDSLKYFSNTLTSISFTLCKFHNDAIGFDALSYLTQLESIQFISCSGLNSKLFQPLLNITVPLKIKTFVFIHNKIGEIIPIQLFIQKIGPYIEKLVLNVYEDESRSKLFDTIIDFGEKIKFLHLNYIGFMDISRLSRMFSTFGNYLRYLTLEIKTNNLMYNKNDDNELKISSMILKELSKSPPFSLYYLDLNLVIDPNELQSFFENCNQVELKKLLIRNRSKNNIDTTLEVIKNFIKERNLVIAYGIGFNGGGLLAAIEEKAHHEGLRKLVEEIQSFSKMMKYDDLVIKVSGIDGSLMNS